MATHERCETEGPGPHLISSKQIAIVVASDKPPRASYLVASYLATSTRCKVYFVNPVVTEILGQHTCASLADIPEPLDIVDAFRKHDGLPGVLAEAVAAGLTVLMDRCVKIEHARFHGAPHLAGFDTGVISAKRQVLA
ncbi:CoA-binding protein [Pseudarthrobacter sp. P1]|uniref:CoA-binding protein n=1 Tax=Pseudarthrobacter sp. P1 TaxID=3418418 RepID=UPI003CF9CBB1